MQTQPAAEDEKEPFIQVHVSDSSTAADKTMLPPTSDSHSSYIRNLRYFFLVALCVQNSSYTLLRRWSTGILMERVSDSSILIGGELIKLGVSLFMTFIVASPHSSSPLAHCRKLVSTSPKMAVPAFVYYCMNRLSFVALRRIDAGTFTVVAQLKTLTTASFSYLILNKQFSAVRVRSLLYLVCSVIVISEFAATHSSPGTVSSADDEDAASSGVGLSTFLMGMFAVMSEVTLSGLISVYYQKVLQDDKRTLSAWDRNIQLAVFSIVLYAPTLHADGYFRNWSSVTLCVAVLGAAGGLLVAFSMKYTDAILKALATSAAIVLTSVLSAWWLDGPYGVPIAVSSVSVVVAIFTYVTNGAMPSWNACNYKT